LAALAAQELIDMNQYIAVDKVVILEERQRRSISPSHINDLEDSFCSASGILHPIVLRDDGVILVAGECRLTAAKQLYSKDKRFTYGGEAVPVGCIPYITLGTMTDDELEEAELDENIKRAELPWQDRAAAIARLEGLRRKQAEQRGERYRQRDVAAEILGVPVSESGTAQKEIRQARLLNDYLDDEEVGKAKTQKDALKIIEKKKKAEHRALLVKEFGGQLASRFPHSLTQGPMEELILDLPDNEFDCIITDPPYGVGADTFNEQAKASHQYQDTEDYALSLYEILAQQSARVCKSSSHLYAFCDIGHFYKIRDIFEAHGWTAWYRPILWFKGSNSGMLPAPEYGPRNTYEAILYCRRGQRKTCHVGPDIIAVPALARPDFGAQKPVALYEELLSRSCDPGDKVLDCFAGAGPVFRAAAALSLHATGFELNPEKVEYILASYLESEDDV
jgi:ParB-like chromosome segregation protein Spo0J